MRKSILVAVCFLSMVMSVMAQDTLLVIDKDMAEEKVMVNEKDDKWNEISHNEYAFTYPDHWQVDTSGLMGTTFIALEIPEDDQAEFRENVNLMIQDLKGLEIDLDEFVSLSENQVKQLVTDCEILKNMRSKDQNGEFHTMTYTGKQGIYDMRFEQKYWLINEKAYILTLTSLKEGYEQRPKTGFGVYSSFQLNKSLFK